MRRVEEVAENVLQREQNVCLNMLRSIKQLEILAEVVAIKAPDQIVVITQSFDQYLRQPSITREIFST